MKNFSNLRVGQWAAVVVGAISDSAQYFGTPAEDDAIPVAIRRRMGRLERLAVRCTLGVLENCGETDELVFCSRHGNLETLVSMLRSIVAHQPMSPMAFSGSVHNAAPGLVGQIRKERLCHTALAAGSSTISAGLIESLALLATEECRDVTLTFADVGLPEPFRDLEEEDATGVAIALRLTMGSDEVDSVHVAQGRTGVLHLLSHLNTGATQIAVELQRRSGAAS
jgi:hypothetical protein